MQAGLLNNNPDFCSTLDAGPSGALDSTVLSNNNFLVVVQSLSHVQLFATPWTTACQASLSFTISQSLLKLMSIEPMMPSNHLVLCHPFSSSVFPSIRVFSNESALHHQVAKVLELQLQHQSFQWIFRIDFFSDWLVWPPCSPRDSQESSPAPQFESINSLVLSFLYGPTLTAIHYYWRNHSFDCMNLHWQCDVSAFIFYFFFFLILFYF